MAKDRPDVEEPLHPIQVVARRTGLTQDAIRVWERRYGAVSPLRTATNRRLYSEGEIDRLILLRRAVLGGRRIREVAPLDDPALAVLVADDERAVASAPRARPRLDGAETRAADRIRRCAEALGSIDVHALRVELQRAAVDLALADFLDRFLVPFLRQVGDAWERGRLSVAQEHLASAVARSTLHALLEAHDRAFSVPVLVVATPPGQRHELGAMAAAVVAAAEGVKVHFLGADLPAEEIVRAVRDGGARAVALSFAPPAPEARTTEALMTLRSALPVDTLKIAGGTAAGAYAGALADAGFHAPSGIAEYRVLLRALL